MIKNKVLFKNLFCIFSVSFLMLIFVGVRCFHFLNSTNLETGVCHEIRTFNFCYILFAAFFVTFSFLFFKFIYKPKFENFNLIKKSKFLGILSFLISLLIFASSFSILFETKSKNSVSAPFSSLFFLTGVFFAASFVILGIYLISDFDFLKFSLSLVFYSAFVWTLTRLFSLVLTNSFLHYAAVEYKLNVLGLIFIFLFFYYFGRLALNYNGLTAGCGFLTFGFSAVFVVFANVAPKLFLNINKWFGNVQINGSFFERNINLFNFYNFNLVDFAVVVFIFLFLIIFMFNNEIYKKN